MLGAKELLLVLCVVFFKGGYNPQIVTFSHTKAAVIDLIKPSAVLFLYTNFHKTNVIGRSKINQQLSMSGYPCAVCLGSTGIGPYIQMNSVYNSETNLIMNTYTKVQD